MYSSVTDLTHLHPLQAANCCRNSRLVVDEDDFKSVRIKNILLLLEQFMKIFVLKPLGFRKLSNSSEIQNYALMHSERLKG